MNIDDIFSLAEKFKLLDLKHFDISILMINFLIITIIFVIYYDLKPKEIIRDKKYLTLIMLMFLVDTILEFFVGNIPAICSIITFFLVNILFMLKDKELFKLFNSDKKNDTPSNTSGDDINFKIKKLGKNSPNELNILDILYVYDYITGYQRRKVMKEMIYDDVNDMAEFLTKRPSVTEEELKEARAILNLISINGKVVTREEAMLYLIDYRNERDKENKRKSGDEEDD